MRSVTATLGLDLNGVFTTAHDTLLELSVLLVLMASTHVAEAFYGPHSSCLIFGSYNNPKAKGVLFMKKGLLVLACIAACLVGSAATAQNVSVNYNHGASFSQYHTYAWASNNTNQIQNSILAQVAQQDIDSAMSQKGFQKVAESQNPDLIITASGGEKEQTSWNAWGMRGFGGGMGGLSPEQNVVATMVVSLYDLKAKELIWRGIAQDTLNTNGNKNQQMVERAVQKMFKQWPKS
jgi:hypothetical protein